MKAVMIMLSLLLYSLICSAQINITLLHQLIDNSKSEHSRQSSLRDKHALSTASESANAAQSLQLQSTYQQLKKKFSTLGMLIELMQVSSDAPVILSQISADQTQIILACQKNPALSFLAIETQLDLVDRASLLLRYLYGLSLSAGELGAMSRSDRLMLISFGIDELRQISLILSGLSKTLSAYTYSRSYGTGFFNMSPLDKQLSSKILLKVKPLKKN
ncbi:hypothetical protein QWY86_05750 [Pedobacter aquatilis]|uniref:hypothetical protein n=1 Tax=Pedobacter aquatilis TaxID=351343 RepID=UPI0025B5C37A|nr:hypothetical protein [Pedobacter aquatilis]MDN3586160.1 hypothetical protein [Pedobacter aquatilis]